MFDFISVVLLASIVPILTWIDFFSFLISGRRFFGRLKFVLQPLVMLGPVMTLVLDLDQKNDCCSDSAIFSPQHRLSAIVLVLVCLSAFFYSTCRKRLAPPLLEVIVNKSRTPL